MRDIRVFSMIVHCANVIVALSFVSVILPAAVPVQGLLAPRKAEVLTSHAAAKNCLAQIHSPPPENERSLQNCSLSRGFAGQRHRGSPRLSQRRNSIVCRAAAKNPVLPTPPPPGQYRLALAGRMAPFLSNFAITPAKARKIWPALVSAVNVGDILFLSVMAWGTMPIARFIYNRLYPDAVKRWRTGRGEEFSDTYIYNIANTVSQLSKVASLVYAADCLVVILSVMGMNSPQQQGLSSMFAKVCYTVWAAMRLALAKRHFFSRVVKSQDPDKLGRLSALDHLLDFVIYTVTGLTVIDILPFQSTGKAVSSLFAVGGVGTLVLGLSSQALARQLITGLAITSSEKFYVGELIELGDGTSGIVCKIGWLDTEIRGGDEIMMRIPNSSFANQRIKNISRMKKSQVLQRVWIEPSEAKKMPELCRQVREEIIKSCPQLIMDGTRPFRVHWYDYEEDHIVLQVDCRFNIPPSTNAYHDNKMTVLEAIQRAVARVDVEHFSRQVPLLSDKQKS